MMIPLSLGRTIVTGAAGFVGAHLCNRLQQLGVEFAAWSRQDLDLTDATTVKAAIHAMNPDTVFHLAAEGVRNPGVVDPGLIERNVAMSSAIARAMPLGSRLVMAGSMTEYGQSGTLREDMPCHPDTDYNRSKLAAAEQAFRIGEDRKVHVINARLFHVFGAGEPAHRLFPHLLSRLMKGEAVPLSDGLQIRDYVHVIDATNALIDVACSSAWQMENSPFRAINVGTGVGLALHDVATWAADSLGAKRDLLRFGARERSPADQDKLVADVANLMAVIGRSLPVRLTEKMDFYRLMTASADTFDNSRMAP